MLCTSGFRPVSFISAPSLVISLIFVSRPVSRVINDPAFHPTCPSYPSHLCHLYHHRRWHDRPALHVDRPTSLSSSHPPRVVPVHPTSASSPPPPCSPHPWPPAHPSPCHLPPHHPSPSPSNAHPTDNPSPQDRTHSNTPHKPSSAHASSHTSARAHKIPPRNPHIAQSSPTP